MSLFGAVVSSVYNEGIADSTNAANSTIQEQVNQANRDIASQTNATQIAIADKNNQTQIDLAEKAYERSTATNQINELIRAGFSPQQAKQIVGSSGSAPSMQVPSLTTPSLTTPEMQAYHYNPYFLDTGSMAAATGAVGQSLTNLANDLKDPDGGFFGNVIADKGVNIAMSKMDKIDTADLVSPKSFLSFLDSDKASSIFDAKEIATIKRIFKSPQGTRALMSQLRRLTSDFTIAQQIHKSDLEIKRLIMDNKLKKLEVDWNLVNYDDMQNMEKEFKRLNLNNALQESQAIQKEFQVRFQQASLNLEAFDNEEYKKDYLASILSEPKMLKYVNDCRRINAEYESKIGLEKIEYEKLFGPWIASWQVFDDAGLTKTNAGAIIAAIVGAGKFGFDNKDAIISGLRELFNVDSDAKVKKQYDEQVKTAEEALLDIIKGNDPTEKIDPFKK